MASHDISYAGQPSASQADTRPASPSGRRRVKSPGSAHSNGKRRSFIAKLTFGHVPVPSVTKTAAIPFPTEALRIVEPSGAVRSDDDRRESTGSKRAHHVRSKSHSSDASDDVLAAPVNLAKSLKGLSAAVTVLDSDVPAPTALVDEVPDPSMLTRAEVFDHAWNVISTTKAPGFRRSRRQEQRSYMLMRRSLRAERMRSLALRSAALAQGVRLSTQGLANFVATSGQAGSVAPASASTQTPADPSTLGSTVSQSSHQDVNAMSRVSHSDRTEVPLVEHQSPAPVTAPQVKSPARAVSVAKATDVDIATAASVRLITRLAKPLVRVQLWHLLEGKSEEQVQHVLRVLGIPMVVSASVTKLLQSGDVPPTRLEAELSAAGLDTVDLCAACVANQLTAVKPIWKPSSPTGKCIDQPKSPYHEPVRPQDMSRFRFAQSRFVELDYPVTIPVAQCHRVRGH